MFGLFEAGRGQRDQQQLGDAVARAHGERFVRVRVEQDDAHLAAVAGVDEPRGVDDRDAVPGGEARTRQREGRQTRRKAEGDARADDGAAERWDDVVLGRVEIEGGVVLVGAFGQAGAVVQQAHGQAGAMLGLRHGSPASSTGWSAGAAAPSPPSSSR